MDSKNSLTLGIAAVTAVVITGSFPLLAKAVPLPSLLGQVNKAKQAEAKNYSGTVNRAEQAYYLEFQKFANSLDELQVGIKPVTDNYSYGLIGIDNEGNVNGSMEFYGKGNNDKPYKLIVINQKGIPTTAVQFVAVPVKNGLKSGLKSYTGGVFTIKADQVTGESLTVAIACESVTPSKDIPPAPKLVDNQPQCPTGFVSLAK